MEEELTKEEIKQDIGNGNLTEKVVDSYDELFGNEDNCLFKIVNDMYTLDERFKIICEGAFANQILQALDCRKVVNFNKIEKIEKGAFNDTYTGTGLNICFDSENIEIEEGAFEEFVNIGSISGFDGRKVNLKLYKESFVIDDAFYKSLQELENLSLYLEGTDWNDDDIGRLQERIKGNVTIFKGEEEVKNEKVSDEISDTEEKEAKTEEKVEIEKEVKTEEGTKVEENKYKAWGEIEDKTKNVMIAFVIGKLIEDEFRIKADIDIDKAIEADGEIKLPKECFIDIKLVSAGGGIVEVLKLLSKPGSNEENILLTDDVNNRKLAKDAIKEYIKGHWNEIIEKGIEHDVKIVEGNIEEKIKDEGARKKFLDENNASKKSSGAENASDYVHTMATKEIEKINVSDVKNIIKCVSVIAKENKNRNEELYKLCKECVKYMKEAIISKGE